MSICKHSLPKGKLRHTETGDIHHKSISMKTWTSGLTNIPSCVMLMSYPSSCEAALDHADQLLSSQRGHKKQWHQCEAVAASYAMPSAQILPPRP